MDQETLTTLGARLYEAEQSQTPIEPLTEHCDLDVADAYAIQEAYSQRRLGDGETLIGRKIGCTSESIQNRFSIDTPDYGNLFEDMVVQNGGEIPIDDLIAPLIEPEIGFILGSSLKGPNVTRQDVLDATESVFPCLEIIDSRIRAWDIEFEDTVADNGSSARCVFGETAVSPDDVDLAAERVQFFKNDELVEAGTGEAVLGHPAEAVAWLANAIGAYGQELAAGQRVLSGSITDAVEIERGDRYKAVFDNLNSVSCSFS